MSIDVRLGTRDEEGPGLVQHIKAGKVDVATIHDVDGSGFRQEHIEGMNVVQLAIRDVDKIGMLPRRSSSVCIFTAALVVRKCAHGKTDRHRAMVVESRA